MLFQSVFQSNNHLGVHMPTLLPKLPFQSVRSVFQFLSMIKIYMQSVTSLHLVVAGKGLHLIHTMTHQLKQLLDVQIHIELIDS